MPDKTELHLVSEQRVAETPRAAMQMVQQDLNLNDINLRNLRQLLPTLSLRYRNHVHIYRCRIHVQCVPEVPEVEYEGMPIIKEIGPIKIDNETEEESNDLIDARKGTFSIKIKTHQEDYLYHEGLIKIVENNFRIISKLNQKE